MHIKTVENAVKKTVFYSYAITQPFAFFSTAQAPVEEQAMLEAEELSYGAHSEIVRHMQLKLNKLGYYTDKIDGIYGLYTERAVRQFQSSENLLIDGKIDSATMKRLINAEKKQEIEKIIPYIEEINYGEKSNKVTYVQEVLFYYGYYTGNIDGIYGPLTEQAIAQIKKEFIVTTAHHMTIAEKMTEDDAASQIEQKVDKENETITKLEIKRLDSHVIQLAKSYIGAPYVWGGTSPKGFDCSGFIQFIFEQLDYQIPRTVSEIWNFSEPVNKLAVGDLVFFETYQPGPSHVGIYLGDGNFIHCSTSHGVTISNMYKNNYWKDKYIGAKRINLS